MHIPYQLALPVGERTRYSVGSALALNSKDGTILVRILGDEFEMGDGKEGNCPKHKIAVSEYWIGVHCVTNRQYGKFVAEAKHRAPDNSNWQKSELADHPVVNVSWDDCVAYAKWAGLSLPTEAQWEKAARGPQGLIYPWGDEWDEKRCRSSKNRGNEFTAAVWAYPEGASGYGTFQQAGNVWEWCADWYKGNYYKGSVPKDPTGPNRGSGRVRRGGGWSLDGASYFRGAYRDWYDPAFRSGYLGFRLVRNSP